MGKCKGHRVRVQLPPEILAMPKGSDLLVTFSTGSVATMAHNWVLALRKAGVREYNTIRSAVVHGAHS